MAHPTVDRKLEAYQISAHLGSQAVKDYEELFQYIAGIPPQNRVVEVEDRVVAVSSIIIKESKVTITAYEGEKGVNPLMFNTLSLSERVEKLRKGEVLATKTHAIIDLVTKKGIVEYNHRGAKADDIAFVLSSLGSMGENRLNIYVQFTHIAGDDFLIALDKMKRIRVARVQFTRPNPGWTDSKTKLSEVADDSNAHSIDVEFTASRGEGLSSNDGIIDVIKKAFREGIALFRKVELRGFEDQTKIEKKVKLEHYVESRVATVPRNVDGLPSDQHVIAEMRKYLGIIIEKKK